MPVRPPRAGRLDADIEPGGIETAFGTVGVDAAERKSAERKRIARRKELESQLKAAQTKVAEATKAATTAERAAASAATKLDRARSELGSIERRLDSLS